MAKDVVYINGVIAARETSLLGGKISKLCEAGAEEALRILSESGFSRGVDVQNVHDYEKLLDADSRDIDAFVREYAPTNAEKTYFLAPRDFHNAKAAVKAAHTGGEVKEMLAPDGLIHADDVVRAVKEGDYKLLYPELEEVIKSAQALLSREDKFVSGADVGLLFENAKFKYLIKACAKNRLLKKLAVMRADMTNVLTAFRSQTPEYAANNMVFGGKISADKLDVIFTGDEQKAQWILGEYLPEGFLKSLFEAKQSVLPFTQAELMLDNIETDLLSKRKYELKSAEPFLYYVLRRRAENANLRIIFVCLMAGMDEAGIKTRLRNV